MGKDINGTHQVLAYENYVNFIGEDIRTIERNADVLLNALAINSGETIYMEIGRHRGMIANKNIRDR